MQDNAVHRVFRHPFEVPYSASNVHWPLLYPQSQRIGAIIIRQIDQPALKIW